jgi:phosphonate transport system substrate-binding protein
MARALFVLLAVIAALAAGCGDDDDAQARQQGTAGAAVPDKLRMAVTDLQGLEELQREFGAFAARLEEATGAEIELFPVSDRTAAAAALAGKQVDLVFTGPAEYVVLHERTDVRPVVAIRRADYRSCIYVEKDSPVQRLTDLRGKKIGMSDIGSTSGHLGPSQLFVDAGIDPQEELEIATVGDAVHAALERGDVDAVGVGCHDRDEYVAGHEDEFRTIVEGPSLPPDVVVAAPEVSGATVQKLRASFQENWPELLKAMLDGKDNAKYAGAELVTVSDSDYDVVRSMYKAIGVESTAEFVGE